MKIGLPRQNTLMSCPSAIGERSTSIGAPAAIVEASGFIWEMNGQRETTPPTAATAPVATKRKSRRVGWSAEDAVVVTIPNPFSSSQPVEPPRRRFKARPEGLPAGARDPPRRQKDRLFRPERPKRQSRNALLAPLPDECKPAIGQQACNARIRGGCILPARFDQGQGMQIALFQPDIPPNTGTIL